MLTRKDLLLSEVSKDPLMSIYGFSGIQIKLSTMSTSASGEKQEIFLYFRVHFIYMS